MSDLKYKSKKEKIARPIPVYGDYNLIPRLKKIFSNTKFTEVDDDLLLIELQKRYPEYKRKKKRPFKTAIVKALEILAEDHMEDSNEYHSGKESFQENSSEFSENENYTIYEDSNLVNQSISCLYKKSVQRHPCDVQGSAETCTSSKINLVSTCPSENNKDTKKRKRKTSVEEDKEKTEIAKERTMRKYQSNSRKNRSLKNKDTLLHESNVTFSDVGGLEETLMEVCMLVMHLKHPSVFKTLGVEPARGFLLVGPPGCGKTLLAHAIAGELGLPFIKLASTEIVSGVSGESESNIRELFDRAINSAPSIVFIDEIDVITPKREAVQKEMEKRIVAQLLVCMDELSLKDSASQVLIIGATNRPDSLDPALRRAGRFDREITVGIPDENARIRILETLCKNMRLSPEFDFKWLAKRTPGYVGADLKALTRETAVASISRVFQKMIKSDTRTLNNFKENELLENKNSNEIHSVQKILNSANDDLVKTISKPTSMLESALSWLKDEAPLSESEIQNLYIELEDFQVALQNVQPSAKREGFATIPDVTWNDIGALKDIQEELQWAILKPVKHKEIFDASGLTSPIGILLCGPPGCGKTLLAKAVSNECGINFISVKGPELLNMYVGESERGVRQCFQRAKNSAPCVIFFDELDALCPRRSDTSENSSTTRVVNQLLTEMDGLEARKLVFVIGATNRPDMIDPAMLRPGRLDKILFVDFPNPEERTDILRTITKNGTKPKLSEDVSLQLIAYDKRCDGFTGADLSALVNQATVTAIKDYLENGFFSQDQVVEVAMAHFETAFLKVKPSVSIQDRLIYEKMQINMALSTVLSSSGNNSVS